VRAWVIAVACATAAGACGDNVGDDSDLAGGAATVVDRTGSAFAHYLPSLSADDIATADAGDGQFEFVWDLPQLGPLYNNTACVNCHTANGRGLDIFVHDAVIGSQGLVRISLGSGSGSGLDTADGQAPGGPVPVPGFGLQLQDHAELGAQEVNIVLSWTEMPGTFGDGSPFSLRAPSVDVRTPDGTEFRADALRSFRQPPAVFGLGLLAAVPDDAILANADPGDANGDGIAGHANQVWDVATQTMVLGRFGHKANVSTLKQQICGAFANDIGVTNTMFPDATGATEIGDTSINSVAQFLTVLDVPAPAPPTDTTRAGRATFTSLGCASCHVPTLVTGDAPFPELANQTIHPYTDLLLHDLGDGLADHRPDFLAGGSEWRTAPLWGLGLVQVVSPQAGYLHDGRARTIEEAILWHGGEAMPAREAYRALAQPDRAALLAFLASL
jgi:CxxC motif-containing protein (DUF1111 family)